MLSRLGVTNPFTAATPAEVRAVRTPPVTSTGDRDPVRAPNGAACWICLEGPSDGNPEALRRNCACRGEGGYVHLSCYVDYARTHSEEIWCGRRKAALDRNWLAFGYPWETCPNCKQFFRGWFR